MQTDAKISNNQSAEIFKLRAENSRLKTVMRRCAQIIRANLYHQNEKISDVPLLIQTALRESP